MITKHEAIYKLYPSVVSIRDDVAYDSTGAIVEYNETAVDNEAALNEYKTLRAAEYPSFADQLDTLYHGGYDAWKASIDAVKNKYPKP